MPASSPWSAKALLPTLGAALTGLAGALALVATALVDERDNRIEAAQAQAQGTARLVAGHVLQTLQKMNLVMRDAGQHVRPGELLDATADAPGRVAEMHRLLVDRLAAIPEATALHLTNRNGDVVYSSLPAVPRVNVADRSHFLVQRDNPAAGLVLSPPLMARTTDRWSMVATRRLDDADGRFAGIVNLVVDVGRLEEFLASVGVMDHGVVDLRDSQMRLVARYPAAHRALGEPVPDHPALDFMSRGLDRGDYRATGPIDGIRRIYSFRAVGDAGLYVMVGLAEQDVLADWTWRAWIYGLAGLLLTAAVLAMLAMAWRSLAAQEKARAALAREEEKFHTVADYTYDWEYWQGPKHEILFMSPSCLRVTGYAVAEFEADPNLVYTIIHPDDRHLMEEHLRDAAYAEEKTLDFRIVRRDGDVRWIAHGCRQVHGRDGRFMGRRSSNRDVTERRRAEEALRRLNRELHAVSECDQALMRAEDEQSLLDQVCRIICDEAGYRMAWVGYAERDEARSVRPVARGGVEDGYLDGARITWADTERGRGPSGIAVRTGTSARVEDFALDAQAQPWRQEALRRGYRSSVALPLKDEGGQVFGVLNIYSGEPHAFTPEEMRLLEELAGDLAFGIGVLRSRIELRRAEGEIRALNRELERRVAERTAQMESANRELEELSYSMSHDMRAPLRAIDGYAKIVLDEHGRGLDDEGRRLLHGVRDSAGRMARQIDDILRFLGMRRRRIVPGPVDVGALAQALFAELQAACPEKPMRLETGELPPAWGDRGMLRQVLYNLLANAVRFAAPERELVVEVGGRADEHEHAWFVRDNGTGFDMRFANKLFRPFERLHATGLHPGTGIGLAIVKRIVERHGGRVWAEGREGEGATFHFALPPRPAGK